MLFSTTELWTPSKAENIARLDAILQESADDTKPHHVVQKLIYYVRKLYDYDERVYTASKAEYMGGGNCFARAETLGSTLASIASKNFIVLRFAPTLHALNLAHLNGELLYADVETLYSTEPGFVEIKRKNGLKLAHKKFVANSTDAPYGTAAYFWEDDSGVKTQRVVSELRERELPQDVNAMHLVISLREGIEMMHAIGDLNRYHGERYAEAWPELQPLTPPFIGHDKSPSRALSIPS